MTQTFNVTDEIRAAMARRKISNSQLAEALDKDVTTISRKIHGSVPITVSELIVIADVLGVPAADLLPASETKAAS